LISTEKPVERTQEVYRFEMKLPAEAKKSLSQTVIEERDVATSLSISSLDDNSIRFFMNNTIASPEVKKVLQGALELKGTLAATQQDLQHVNEQLKVISDDQGRLRANLREMPSTAAAYKRYLEKFDKQETEIEKLQEQQKKLQAEELKQRQELEKYLTNIDVK
jgi:septal ring factor EnvC (AmiA/AmiB activator)